MVGFRGFVEGGSRLWSRGVNGAACQLSLTRSRAVLAQFQIASGEGFGW